MGKAWKNAEKEIAKFFGGMRRVRVSYSDAIGDILHPCYSIEVKYGGQVPKYLSHKHPVSLISRGRKYLVVPSQDLIVKGDTLRVKTLARLYLYKPTVKFLEAAMEQARSYDPELDPLVCVKPRFFRGFIAVWEVW